MFFENKLFYLYLVYCCVDLNSFGYYDINSMKRIKNYYKFIYKYQS